MRTTSLLAASALLAALAATAAVTPSDASLVPEGAEFQVASETSSSGYAPRVAMEPAGSFVVAWQSATLDWDVRARRFDPAGAALADDFEVNAYTTGRQQSPALAVGHDGSFVVAWSGAGLSDPDYGAFARVFAADGAPAGGDVALHESTELVAEREPAAAAVRDGFLIAWIERSRVAGVHVDGGGGVSAPFERPVDEPQRVALGALPAAEFVVVWSTYEYARSSSGFAYGSLGHVTGSRLAADGAAVDDFQVNAGRDDPTGYGFVADGRLSLSVAADAAGDFVVGHDSSVPSYVYNVDEQVDGYDLGARFERFSGAGHVSEGSQAASDQDTGPATQIGADVAMTPGGNVVAVWSDDALMAASTGEDEPDEDGEGIFARAVDCRGEDLGGGVVQVNAHTTGDQRRAAVAVNEAGDVVVVWQTPHPDGEGFAIVGRRFALSGGCALCGDADVNGRVTAGDALAALRTSVGSHACALERCDADASQEITAADALRILAAAVAEGALGLECGRTPS